MMQLAHPAFEPVVHDAIRDVVSKVTSTDCPRVLHAVVKRGPSKWFQTRVVDQFVVFQTPRYTTIHWTEGGVTVVMTSFGARAPAKIELRVRPYADVPTFATLEKVLATMWWFTCAAKNAKLAVDFETRSEFHRPTIEVLNTVAETFVERVLAPLLNDDALAPVPVVRSDGA